jgi:excisionase family DNA binding protein
MNEKPITDNSNLQPGALLNRNQIAKFLGVSPRTISNMVRQRRIPVIKFGGTVRFDPVRVRRALDKYEISEI